MLGSSKKSSWRCLKVHDGQSGCLEHSDGGEEGHGRQMQQCFSSCLSRTLWQECLESRILACGLSDL